MSKKSYYRIPTEYLNRIPSENIYRVEIGINYYNSEEYLTYDQFYKLYELFDQKGLSNNNISNKEYVNIIKYLDSIDVSDYKKQEWSKFFIFINTAVRANRDFYETSKKGIVLEKISDTEYMEPVTQIIFKDDEGRINGKLLDLKVIREELEHYMLHPLEIYRDGLEEISEEEFKKGKLTNTIFSEKLIKIESESRELLKKDIQKMVDIEHLLALEENKVRDNAEKIINNKL